MDPGPISCWYTNIAIFNKVLAHFLDPGERVEADNGYLGHPDKVKCPEYAANPRENVEKQARVQSRHKTLNGRLRNWGILHRFFAMTSLFMAKCFELAP